MLAYQSFQKMLVPYVEQNVPSICIDSIKKLAETHKDALQHVSVFYDKCKSHTDYLQKILDRCRSIFSTFGVEYSEKGISLARDKLEPVFKNFKEQRDETDKVAHAILWMLMDYINDSPFNSGVKLEGAPTLALMGVNMFIVAFSSTLVAMANIQNKMKTKDK